MPQDSNADWKSYINRHATHAKELKEIDALYPHQLTTFAKHHGVEPGGTPLELRWKIASNIVGKALPEPTQQEEIEAFVGLKFNIGLSLPGYSEFADLAKHYASMAKLEQRFVDAGWTTHVALEGGNDCYADLYFEKESDDQTAIEAEAIKLLGKTDEYWYGTYRDADGNTTSFDREDA